MTCTSRALRKSAEDAEIFHVLQ